MYSSSKSSSSQSSMDPSGSGSLMRYCSAPSSLLTTAVDSVIGATREFSVLGHHQNHLSPAPFFPCETSESNDKANRHGGVPITNNLGREEHCKDNTSIGLQRAYGFGGGGGGASSSLVRHSSSPAGFLNQLASVAGDNGFSITRSMGSYNPMGITENGHGIARLNSQLSFTRQESLSRISEEDENVAHGIGADNGQRKSTHSYVSAGFGLGSTWDETHPVMFSVASGKRAKTVGADACIATSESQFQYSMPDSALEMSSMDKLLHIPHDSVPCKIRAKRGCATHPRSIAERERRTRISGKLKKLQDLVPNMDKQTSYADMLDLAVQHINSLQNQVQKLNKEIDCCKCGCKKNKDS